MLQRRYFYCISSVIHVYLPVCSTIYVNYEQISGRLGYSIRGTLQSQAKAFVETQHESRVSISTRRVLFNYFCSGFLDILFLLQMTKMRAILEQENWTEIDVPDEYQAIVTSLFSLESSTNGPKNESACDMATSNSDASLVEEAKQSTLVQHTVQTEIGASGEVVGQVNPSRSRGETINNNAEVEASVTQNNDSNVKDKERGRSSIRTLSYGGVGYHMVNWSVLMLTNLYFINPFTSWLVSMFPYWSCIQTGQLRSLNDSPKPL